MYFHHLPFSLNHSTKEKPVISWGTGARLLDFIRAYKTYATFSFLRSIHCRLDILCIVKTLSSAYHQAQVVLLTNLLTHFYSSGCNSLFQPPPASPCYSSMTSIQYPQALLFRSFQYIVLKILYQFQHLGRLAIPLPITTKGSIIQYSL